MIAQTVPFALSLSSLVPVIAAIISVIAALSSVWLKRQMDESTTRFSWLHEARAKAMMEIYARSIAIEGSVRKLLLTRDWDPSGFTLSAIRDRADDVREALLAFDGCYKPNRLLFSQKIAHALDDLSARYGTITKVYDDTVNQEENYNGVEAEALEAVARNLPQTDALIRNLELEFRKLYGSS